MKYKRIFLILSAFFYMLSIPGYGEDLKDRPDSIRYIMGINVDDSVIEELSGDNITGFRLYTSEGKSCIVWKIEKNFYIYSTSEVKALELFKQLQKNGIITFVAERVGKSLRFHKYHRVVALQLAGAKI